MTKVRLADVANFIRGITFKPEDKVIVGTPGSVVCMRTKNIQENLDQRDLISVPERFVKKKEKMILPGDILVSSANSWDLVGKCCYVESLFYPSAAGGFISILRSKENSSAKFIYYWMISPEMQVKSRQCGRQTTNISNLDVNRYLELPFPNITYDEQNRAVSILDKADAVRRKHRQILIFVNDFRRSTFLEVFGDPITNPKGWPSEPMSKLLRKPLRNGVSPSSTGTHAGKVLTLSAITGQSFDEACVKTGMFDLPLASNDAVQAGEFYICRGNGNPNLVGKGFFATTSIADTAFPDTMIAAQPDPNRVNRAYFEALWNSQAIRSQIVKAARTTNGTFKVNQTAIENIQIVVPSQDAQEDFQRKASSVNGLIKRSKEALAEANQLFASLSQRAFRGEL